MRRRGALPVPTFAPLPQRVAQSLPTAAAQTDRAAARSVTDWRERRQTAPLVRVGVVARLVVPLSPSYDPCLSMWFEPRLARAGGAPPPRSRRCATQLHSHPPMLPRPPRAGTPPTPASPPSLWFHHYQSTSRTYAAATATATPAVAAKAVTRRRRFATAELTAAATAGSLLLLLLLPPPLPLSMLPPPRRRRRLSPLAPLLAEKDEEATAVTIHASTSPSRSRTQPPRTNTITSTSARVASSRAGAGTAGTLRGASRTTAVTSPWPSLPPPCRLAGGASSLSSPLLLSLSRLQSLSWSQALSSPTWTRASPLASATVEAAGRASTGARPPGRSRATASERGTHVCVASHNSSDGA